MNAISRTSSPPTVKAFFDTSVLVPVFYGDHEHHTASLSLFLKFTKDEACCGAHTLAEIYSTLTRMPGKYRVTGDQAMLFVGSVLERLDYRLDRGGISTALESGAGSR